MVNQIGRGPAGQGGAPPGAMGGRGGRRPVVAMVIHPPQDAVRSPGPLLLPCVKKPVAAKGYKDHIQGVTGSSFFCHHNNKTRGMQ